MWSKTQTEKDPQKIVLKLGLIVTIDQMAIANSVCWYGDLLRRVDGHEKGIRV